MFFFFHTLIFPALHCSNSRIRSAVQLTFVKGGRGKDKKPSKATTSISVTHTSQDRILNSIVGKLRDPDEKVRIAAAKSLAEITICNDTVLMSLLNVVQNDTPAVQLAAVDTLGKPAARRHP